MLCSFWNVVHFATWYFFTVEWKTVVFKCLINGFIGCPKWCRFCIALHSSSYQSVCFVWSQRISSVEVIYYFFSNFLAILLVYWLNYSPACELDDWKIAEEHTEVTWFFQANVNLIFALQSIHLNLVFAFLYQKEEEEEVEIYFNNDKSVGNLPIASDIKRKKLDEKIK